MLPHFSPVSVRKTSNTSKPKWRSKPAPSVWTPKSRKVFRRGSTREATIELAGRPANFLVLAQPKVEHFFLGEKKQKREANNDGSKYAIRACVFVFFLEREFF